MRVISWAVMFVLAAFPALAAEFHVAAGGDDTHAGTASAPFASLERARDAVRALKEGEAFPEGGVTVWLHRGEHFFADTGIYSCAGAPLFGPDGTCLGMIDVTGVQAHVDGPAANASATSGSMSHGMP